MATTSRPDSSDMSDVRRPESALRDPLPWYVRFQGMADEFTESEKRVGVYLRNHPESAERSISEVVDISGLGYGTIVRFCQKLGCRGFQEFKVLMARDAVERSPAPPPSGHGAYAPILQRLSDDITHTAQRLDVQQVDRAADALSNATRVVCVGVASSAPLAMSLEWRLKRFGIVSSCVSDGYVMAVEAALLREGGVLFAVSSSGTTKDVVAAARLAYEGGGTVIAMTNFTKAPLTEVSHIQLITSAARDPLLAELPSLTAGEMVYEILVDEIRRRRPEVDQTVYDTFSAIADRKL
jgi:RpiR family transcriptional regulator, carbohydrate utilization regulator